MAGRKKKSYDYANGMDTNTAESFIASQEKTAKKHSRNSRKALDSYMEKKRLRDNLTFFELDFEQRNIHPE